MSNRNGRSFVLALVLAPLFAAPAARGDVMVLGPQRDVTPIDYSSYDPSDQGPVLATNGTDFLAAWQGRNPAGANVVYCARFSGSGVLLDKDAMRLSIPSGPPRVFWDGTKYLVVTTNDGQRVDPQTGALDAPLKQWGFLYGGEQIAHAFGDGLIFQGSAYGPSVDFSVMNETGKVVGSPPLYHQPLNAVAAGYANGTFLFAWINGGVVQALRLSKTATILDAMPIMINAGHTFAGDAGAADPLASLGVASSPTGFLVTWSDPRNGGHDIYSARVGTDGSVADPGGFFVASNAVEGQPTATWTGTNWWLAWNTYTTLPAYTTQSTTLEPDNRLGLITTLGGALTYYTETPALAANGSMLLAAWQGKSGILGSRFDTTHALVGVPGVSISSHIASQSNIRLATSSAGHMVGWTSAVSDATGNPLYQGSAMRLAPDGSAIDTTPIPIFQNPSGKVLYGALATTYAAAYVDHGIQIATLDTSVVPPVFKTVATVATNTGGYAYEPLAMACMSDRCILVWYDNNAANTYPTYSVVVMADGTLTTPALVGSDYRAVAGSDGTSFLMAHSGKMFPVAADGTVGTPRSNVAYGPLVWGTDRYLLLNWVPTTTALERYTAAGAPIGASESAPSFVQMYGAGGAGWDGRSFIIYNGPTAAEVPLAAPSTGLVTFPLFDTANVVKVASVTPGSSLALGADPRGGSSALRAVIRTVSFAPDAVDGGQEAGAVDGGIDGGSLDGGEDAGSDAGGDAAAKNDGGTETDAGHVDAGMGDDAGFAPDSGARDAGSDATVIADGGHDAAIPSHPSDASLPGDAIAPSDQTGGCSCNEAGGDTGRTPIGALLTIASVIAAVRRRKTREGARVG